MADSADINGLLRGAFGKQNLSKKSMEVLAGTSTALERLPGGLSIDDLHDTDVLLATIVGDDSGSIKDVMEQIREGHNKFLKMLREEARRDSTMVSTRLLNGSIVNAFCLPQKAVMLDAENFSKERLGGTPLYWQAVITLGTILAQTEALERRNCRVTSITLLISDGEDNGENMSSGEYKVPPGNAAWLVRDLEQTGNHRVAAYGVRKPESYFRPVFVSMGVDPEWIMTSLDVLEALARFRQVVQKASIGHEQARALVAGSGVKHGG